ncbi:MAG: hypothetical protein ACI92I_000005 [Acidimicrobiales bacterium]|jgi:hypothetical protein
MNSRIYFILGFTFLVGMFSGAYLYVTSFVPEYVVEEVEEVSEIGFRVQGQMTGGCGMRAVCPSFILNQNRSYEYVPAYILQEGAPELIKGKLDRGVFEEVSSLVKEADLQALQKINTKGCDSYVDGTDYVYNVTFEGQQYDLNTCGMDFKDSVLDKELRSLWTQVATSTSETPPIFEGGLGEYFKL